MRLASQILALATAALAIPGLACAETFVLDTNTGAAYDSVGDGWFFTTPPNQPPDGIGDAGGQALAIGKINGTLELRAMAEFPLASLAGLTPSQIASATVTFKIDDVIASFGPGATFDGTASSPIAVYHYPADGTVTVADFSPAGLGQLGIVTPGVVTDATLAISGAVRFDVDATAALKAALTNGETAFGVLFGTADSPTATSIDGLAPPGVAGGALPIITIETIPLTPPVLTGAEQTCQTTIAKAAAKAIATGEKGFSSCFALILKDYAPDSALAATTAPKCAGLIDHTVATSKLGKDLDKLASGVASKCAGLVPADIGSPCNPAATTFAQTSACLRQSVLGAVQSSVGAQYATACSLLNSVGLGAKFPSVCIP